ncbi:MAG: hypothetical protein WAM99_20315, partial [Xanthobacteraceae bacterium]
LPEIAASAPDGQITQLSVQPPAQKYSGVLFTQITSISLAIPAHTEGRFAIVTDVGQGCGGRGSDAAQTFCADERR